MMQPFLPRYLGFFRFPCRLGSSFFFGTALTPLAHLERISFCASAKTLILISSPNSYPPSTQTGCWLKTANAPEMRISKLRGRDIFGRIVRQPQGLIADACGE